VVGKKKRVVYGEPSLGDIETMDVENFNGILRERLGRLVRESKCFSNLNS
jgi:IS1 family transposase